MRRPDRPLPAPGPPLQADGFAWIGAESRRIFGSAGVTLNRWKHGMSQKGVLVAVGLAVAVAAAFPAEAEDLKFTLINESSADITALQISPVSTRNWEENILGRDTLPKGYEVDIVIADNLSTCSYDMLITFKDGSNIEERNYNFCDLKSYTARD